MKVASVLGSMGKATILKGKVSRPDDFFVYTAPASEDDLGVWHARGHRRCSWLHDVRGSIGWIQLGFARERLRRVGGLT